MTMRYVNRNQFPVILPDQRGGQVMFRPGEGTTSQWFSRMCSPRQLTREGTSSLRPNSLMSQTVKIKAPTIVKGKPQTPKITETYIPEQKPILSFNDEETPDYKLAKGIYCCKHCDGIFRTGSSTSMNAHLIEYHLKQAQIPKPEPKYGQDEHEGEKVAQTAQQSATQFITKEDEEKEEVRTTMPQQQAQPEVPQPVEQFACSKPGCGKAFKTQKALRMHETRMHK